jgi:hypothetical protein
VRALLFALLVACRGEVPNETESACEGIACASYGVSSCSAGFESDGDRGCKPILKECAEGEVATPGECTPVGVTTCGPGFVREDHGCRAIVANACDGPKLAKLGETDCVPIQVCGTDRFPKTTVPAWYVDAAYVGTSDGSEAQPFASLGDAVAAATASKNTIVVSSGKYGPIAINRSVTIVGLCPDKTTVGAVTVTADATLTGISSSAIRVEKGNLTIRSTWVRDVGPGITLLPGTNATIDASVITASEVGLALDGARALLKSSEIRSTMGSAVRARAVVGKPSDLTVRSSVITDSTGEAVFTRGSIITIEDTLIRRTGKLGAVEASGIYADTLAGQVPNLTVKRSVIDTTFGMSIGAFGGTASIEDTTVRSTRLSTSGPGIGVLLGVDPKNRAQITGTVAHSLFAQVDGVAFLAGGSNATLRASVIRDVRETPGSETGRGISITPSRDGLIAPTFDASETLIERCAGGGVVVAAGEARFDRMVIRDITADLKKKFGYGLLAYSGAALPPSVSFKRGLVERTHDAGLISFGTHFEVEDTVVRSILPRALVGAFGHGIHITSDEAGQASSGFVRGSVVQDVFEVGIQVFQSDFAIENTTIDTIKPSALGIFGDGVSVTAVTADIPWREAKLSLRAVKIAGAARAAISTFNAHADATGVLSRCSALDIAVESITDGHPPTLKDGGGNACGCDKLSTCVASQKNLEPIATPL